MKKVTFLSVMLVLMIAFVQCDGGGNSGGGGTTDPDPVDTLIKDGDGNVYTKVVIGNQTWLKENLKTTKYNDGTPIVHQSANSAWASSTSGAYCWYDNSESNKNTYGALYNNHVASSGKICPEGWHVPFASEWATLVSATGKEASAGANLKESGTDHWTTEYGTNESGFTALPNGRRKSDGSFEKMRTEATFWTRDVGFAQEDAIFYYLEAEMNSARRAEEKKECGFAIRCIKN